MNEERKQETLRRQEIKEEVERRKREAQATKEAILNLLPRTREDAISIRDLANDLPNIAKQSITANMGFLRKDGWCYSEKRYFGKGDTRPVYWKRKTPRRIIKLEDLILDIIKEQDWLSTREITDQLAGLGYIYDITTVRTHLRKKVANGILMLRQGGPGTHNRYMLTDNYKSTVIQRRTVAECAKELLPRTEEEAMASRELHAICNWYPFTAITSGLSNMYLLGIIKRRGHVPYKYWLEQTEEETGKPMRNVQNPLLDTPSVDVISKVVAHSAEQDMLARIRAVEDNIANIRKRYKEVEQAFESKRKKEEQALKRRELDARLKKAEVQRDEEERKLEKLETELRKWSVDDAGVTEGILK